jgi:hypothetical protein
MIEGGEEALHEALRGAQLPLAALVKIANGNFGTVFALECERWPRLREWLSSHGTNVVAAAAHSSSLHAARPGEAQGEDGSNGVAVKVQALPNDAWERDAVCEDRVHHFASRMDQRFPDGTTVRGCDTVPVFSIGATTRPSGRAGTGTAFRITLMERLTDATRLGRLIAQRSPLLSADTYWSLERATCALWMQGIAHSDLHDDNVLVLPDGSVRLVDFGMAAVMPRNLRVGMRAALAARSGQERRQAPERCFDALYRERAFGVMRKRGVEDAKANIDSDALKGLRRQGWMRGHAEELRSRRAALWSPSPCVHDGKELADAAVVVAERKRSMPDGIQKCAV